MIERSLSRVSKFEIEGVRIFLPNVVTQPFFDWAFEEHSLHRSHILLSHNSLSKYVGEQKYLSRRGEGLLYQARRMLFLLTRLSILPLWPYCRYSPNSQGGMAEEGDNCDWFVTAGWLPLFWPCPTLPGCRTSACHWIISYLK